MVNILAKKSLFLSHTPNFETLISSGFLFQKNLQSSSSSFSLTFLLSIKYSVGEMIFCQKFGKRGVKH